MGPTQHRYARGGDCFDHTCHDLACSQPPPEFRYFGARSGRYAAASYSHPLSSYETDWCHTAGLVLGIAFLITWVISIGGIIQRNNKTGGLIITNWALIMDATAVVVIGCIVWFYTLQETNNFLKVWETSSPATLQTLQDTVSASISGEMRARVILNTILSILVNTASVLWLSQQYRTRGAGGNLCGRDSCC